MEKVLLSMFILLLLLVGFMIGPPLIKDVKRASIEWQQLIK